MSQKQSLKAISRVYKDLQEFEDSPLEGLSVCMPNENDPFTLRSNIRLLGGIYEGIQLHTEIKIPSQYPLKAPKMSILKGQPFNHDFHHHIYDRDGGYTVCIDLLDHGFFAQQTRTGWVPEYTLSTMLVQMQSFFAFNHESHASLDNIEKLKETLKSYQCEIKLTDGSIKLHRFDDPYPPYKIVKKLSNLEEIKEKENQYERYQCHILKTSPFDKELLFGLPLFVTGECKIDLRVIFEILSYDAYLLIKKEGPKKFSKITAHDSDQPFNVWLPLYFDESSYQKFKSIYLKSFSFIFDGGKTLINEKKLLHIFRKLFVYALISISERKVFSQKIDLFCLLIRLFLRILEEYPNIEKLINEKISKKMLENNEEISEKKITEFFCLLPFTNFRKHLPAIFIEIFKKKSKDFIEKNCMKENIPDFTLVNEIFKFHKHYYTKIVSSFLFFEIIMKSKSEFVKMIDENIGAFNPSPFFLSLEKSLIQVQKINSFDEIFKYMECMTPSTDNSIILNLVCEVYENISKNSSFFHKETKEIIEPFNEFTEPFNLEKHQFYIGNLFLNE